MALRNRPSAAPIRTITAAAERIPVGSKADARRLEKLRQEWQSEAWAYYDSIGEIKYVGRFKGNALSRLRLYVAYQADDMDAPVPIDSDDADINDDLRQAAIGELDRIQNAEGGTAELLRGLGTNLDIAGECYLVGLAPNPQYEQVDEEWSVRSVDEIETSSDNRIKLCYLPGANRSQSRVLTDNDFVLRIWQRHPRWSQLADSSMRGVLDLCDELLILNKAIRAVARSRIGSAGFLTIPEEINLRRRNPTHSDGDGNKRETTFQDDLMRAMVTPIQDEGAASAVVPIVITGKAEYLTDQYVRFIEAQRPIDPVMAEQRAELIRRIAQGLDIPLEIVLGVGDINHWGAWAVDESTFKSHVEPTAIVAVEALSYGFLRPALKEYDPEQVRKILVWYDPTELVTHPNRSQDAKDVFDRDGLSWDALARYTGFNEDDMPTPQEMLVRAIIAGRIDPTALGLNLGQLLPTNGDSAPIEIAPPPTPAPEQTPTEPGPPTSGGETGPPANPAEAGPPALTAAMQHRGLVFGRKLVAIDRDLRTRVHAAADAALTRALAKAGARLRSKMGKNSVARQVTATVPAEMVAATIGPQGVMTLGATEDELLAESFDDLQTQFRKWTAQAQKRTLQLYDDEFGIDDLQDGYEAQFEQSRDAAGRWLGIALVGLAVSRLYDPNPAAPPQGEIDESMGVPAGLVRQALAIAGGASDVQTTDAGGAYISLGQSADITPLGGVATGLIAQDLLSSAGGGIAGYEWDYGPAVRTRPFEPHEELDGAQFENFDDPVLSNREGDWPGPYYLPGDHFGCQCDVTPVVLSPEDVGVAAGGFLAGAAARRSNGAKRITLAMTAAGLVQRAATRQAIKPAIAQGLRRS